MTTCNALSQIKVMGTLKNAEKNRTASSVGKAAPKLQAVARSLGFAADNSMNEFPGIEKKPH